MLIVERRATGYDADAQAYISAIESADGATLEKGVKDAINTLILRLKGESIWSSIMQILLPCGPRTLQGALVPLKGATPTNNGFTSQNYSRKAGLGNAGNNRYLNSNISGSTIPATNHALFAYGAIAATSGDKILIGVYAGTDAGILTLDEWSPYVGGRSFRSGSNSLGYMLASSSTAAATCMIGSRTSVSLMSLYVDGAAFTNSTTVGPSFPGNLNVVYYALNAGSIVAYSPAVLQAMGIFSSGLSSTQATNLRSAFAAYVSSVAAAIP